MALIYITAISLIVVALADWVTNDLTNTVKFSNAAQFDSALKSVTQLGIQNIRYNPQMPATQSPQFAPCWLPATNGESLQVINGYSVAVWCSTVQNLASAQTRVVTLDACASALSQGQCTTAPALQAKVTFDDYLPGNSAYSSTTCSPPSCGSSAVMQYWSFGSISGGVPPPSSTTTLSGYTTTSTLPVSTTSTTVPPTTSSTTTSTTTTTTTVPPTTTTTATGYKIAIIDSPTTVSYTHLTLPTIYSV